MMFKKVRRVIVLLIGITLILPINRPLALENKGKIVIIYDEYKEYASETNNLNCLIKIALTTGKNIELRNVNRYTSSDLSESEGIIVLSNKEGSFDKVQIEELYKSREKLLWIGKNSSDSKVIPLNFYKLEGTLEIKKKINEKFNDKKNKNINCYIVIDEFYPYDDLNLLIKKADYLYEQGIPFLVCAMPVYENLELDAMKRYTEALRYAVSKGGAIILGDPYLYDKGPTEDELISKISTAQDAFVNYKVNPIALTINDYLLYRNDRVKYLDKASTIIINENENLGVIDFEKYSISAFDNVLIKVDRESLDFSKDLLTDVAIGIKGNDSFEDFQKEIDIYKKMGIEFSNPINLDSKLTFGNNKITNNRDGLKINDINVGGNKFISNDKLYSDEGQISEENKKENQDVIDLTKANKLIFIISIMGIIVFIVFFLYSLKIDRKKYFK